MMPADRRTGAVQGPIVPARRAGLVVLLALVLVLAGCGSTPTATPPPASGSLPSPALSAPALSSPVVGVVIAVDSAGLDKVSGFTLRLKDGTQQAFRIGILENGVQFPPGHLKEHAVSADPVRVFFRPEGGDLVVYRIEDAG